VLEGLEREARFVEFLIGCTDPRDLGDAYVTLSLVKSDGPGLDGVKLLTEMYLGFARRRRLETEVLDDHRTTDPVEDSVTLLLSGPCAHGLLASEAGIHQVSRSWTESGSRGRKRSALEVVRVEVLPVPPDSAVPSRTEVRPRVKALSKSAGRFLAPPVVEVNLLHSPTMTSVRAWTGGGRDEAVARLLPLLTARIDGPAAAPGGRAGGVVRRYALGPSGRVRDRRTGLDTGHADRVLRGEIDAFLLHDGAAG
jgi:protein subunit release factor A